MFAGIAAGIVLAMFGVAGMDGLAHALFPVPPGLDLKDPAVLATYVEGLHFGAKAIVAAGWFLAPFLGALAAIVISRESISGWIVASAFLAAATYNLVLIPHPQWMVVACFVFPGLAAILAQQAISGRIDG